MVFPTAAYTVECSRVLSDPRDSGSLLSRAKHPARFTFSSRATPAKNTVAPSRELPGYSAVRCATPNAWSLIERSLHRRVWRKCSIRGDVRGRKHGGLFFREEEGCVASSIAQPSAPDTEKTRGDSQVVHPLSKPDADHQSKSQDPPLRVPRYVWRGFAALIMVGQVVARTLTGRIHWRNTLQQLAIVGPGSLGVSLLTACFVGMAFTIQFVREFTRLGLTRSVGGVLSLALARELSPVVTAIIMAGRVGSSFAAELGTMQVSEQTDTLRVLKTDPVDYLVTPRVLACAVAMPVLTILCFSLGLAASIFLADAVFSVNANVILDSAARALQRRDLVSMVVKSFVFGGIIAEVSCAWGMTTQGGAKGVGESTTSAVVISLVCVFIADFALSWAFFQGGPGDSLKAAMG